jgi:hypothetical protein
MDVTYLSYDGTKPQLATGNLLWISFALMVEKYKVSKIVVLVLTGLASYML